MPYLTASPYNSTSSQSPYACHMPQNTPQTTPPSSAFFSSHPDDKHEMQPISDTEQHFGSSSSFQQHSSGSGPMANLESIHTVMAEQGPSNPEQNGYELAPKAAEQTPLAKYMSYTAEVRPLFVPYLQLPPDEI
jgi:hypothetical protein